MSSSKLQPRQQQATATTALASLRVPLGDLALGGVSLLGDLNTLPDFSCNPVPKWVQDLKLNLAFVAVTEGASEVIEVINVAMTLCGLVEEGELASGVTPLYRAVIEPELEGIQILQEFENPYGIESKYFSTNPEGAASYAKQAYQAFGDGPFTLVKTGIPTNLITEEMLVYVDRGISTVVVPTELLSSLVTPEVLNVTPLPYLP